MPLRTRTVPAAWRPLRSACARALAVGTLVVSLSVVATAVPATGAVVDPVLKCGLAKMQAALRDSAGLNACFRRALQAGTAPDPACVDAVDTNLAAAFAKIEARGGCSVTGDAGGVQRILDRSAFELVRSLSGTCVQVGGSCETGVLSPCCAGLSCTVVVLGQPATCE